MKNPYPTILSPAFGNPRKIFLGLVAKDDGLYNEIDFSDNLKASLRNNSSIFRTEKDVKDFFKDSGIDIADHVVYDVDTKKLTNVSEEEMNLLKHL